MKIRIWGARGSIPSPLQPREVEEKICQAILGLPDIDTHDEEAVRAYVSTLPTMLRGTAGGNTPCIEIQTGGELFVMDAGSGIQALGQELMKGPFGRGEGVMHLFISHLHWDHLQGFTMFLPAFRPGNRIFIYGVHDVKTALERQQYLPFWPRTLSYTMRADLEFISLEAGQPFAIGNVLINTLLNTHRGDAYSYRFEDRHSVFVYASDAEYKQLDEASLQPRIEFFRNADALIFDAMYTTPVQTWQREDWGHSSAMIGVDLARAAGVKQLLLFHHSPSHLDAKLEEIQTSAIDYQAQDTTRPICKVLMAYEGLTLDLASKGAVALQLTPDGEAAILTPTSIFDERGVDQLAQQLARLAEHDTHTRSIIDLSQVETLTTVSLKSLVALRQELEEAPIVLVGPSDSILQIIKLAGCADYFAIYPTVETALEAVQARQALKLPGHMIKDRYQIQNKISDGQMGTVLKATDTHLDRTVAINILYPYFSSETIARFMRQSRQIMSMDHPNIVTVFDWDQEVDYTFQIEEFITDPTTLYDLLVNRDNPLPIEHAMNIALDITHTLEYAYSWNVIHGDLKPQNVFLTGDGSRLSGFGLGLLEEGHNLLDAPLILMVVSHLAPEQILGQPLDVRTDLYALGVILYQLFTGQLPFEGTEQQVMRAHLEIAPTPPRELNPHLSRILDHLILKLLAKDPDDRYTGAQQVQRILSSLFSDAKGVTHRRTSPLAGREKQLHTLQTCWNKARAGQGQLAFITGRPGIGKTSLAQQVAVQCEPPVLLTGRCQALKGSPPYYLFAEVLRAYLDIVSLQSLDQESRQLLSNFAHLVPEIRQMQPQLPEPTRLDPKQEHLRLMSSLTQFIEQATQEHPWLLILDDLQWADQSSLELLSNLGHHIPSMSLLIIGIYSDLELERDHPLLETLRNLNLHPTYRRFPLDRLNQEEVGQVLTNMWDQPVPEALIKQIYRHTEGNPLYVEEVAWGLVDDGLVALRNGKWDFPAMEEVRLPPNMREAIWRRIRHLKPDTQTLLRHASVLGQVFKLDDLQAMSDLSVLEHLDMALERQLVQEAPGEGTLYFCHTEIQDVLYVDLGSRQRRLLHNQAGDAIEQRVKHDPERMVVELAHHFSEAGRFEKAITYRIQAAQRAEDAYANGAALLWYTQTLEMLDQLDPEEALGFKSMRVSAHKALGGVLIQIGQYDEALEHYASALFKWLDKGSRYIAEAEQTIEIVRIYLFGAELYYRQGKYDEAVSWCRKSLDIISQIETRESQQVRGRACYLLGDICVRSGDLTYAVQFCRESVQVYQWIDDLAGQANAYNKLGFAYYYQGSWPQAQDAYYKSLAMREEIGDVSGRGQVRNNLALIHLDSGEWDGAMSLLEQSLAIWRQISATEEEARTLSHLAQVHIYRKNWSEALACLSRSQDTFIQTGFQIGSDQYLPELERRWGEFYLMTGELDQALDHALRSVELAVEQSNPLKEGLSCRMLGRVHLARQENEPAEAALRQSLQIFGDLDSKYEIARTKLSLARMAVETDEISTDEARMHLTQAIETFAELGARADLAAARSLEQQL